MTDGRTDIAITISRSALKRDNKKNETGEKPSERDDFTPVPVVSLLFAASSSDTALLLLQRIMSA